MKLVMVHGRAQGGKDPVCLKKEWLDALNCGLACADMALPDVTSIDFPFYGDLLDELVEQTETPLGVDVNAKGPNPDAELNLRGEIISELAAAIGVTDEDVFREFEGPVEKGPGNWEWVQGIMRALDRVPGLNSSVIDLFTRDVYVYLTFPGVRVRIDRCVREAISDERCVVLAHSLGTIIAYNVLYRRPPQPPCERFITVGSPLGIRAIKQHIESPLRSPPCVGHWFNAFDDRDFVALKPLDSSNFDVRPSIENKRDVKNLTDNRHGISGYLANPVVAHMTVERLE